MKTGAPWSVKGVEADARETAKAKAKAAGMTLGQWLNRAIADADKPASPQPAPAAGGSLETARVMRAIAEVARRVDQIRDSGETAIPDSARLEAALGDLNARLDRMAEALPAGEQRIDQQRLERGMLAIVRRLDEMDRKASEAPDLGSLRQAIDDLSGRLPAEAPDAPDETAELKAIVERQAADIRTLTDGLSAIGGKLETLDAALRDLPDRIQPAQEAGQEDNEARRAAIAAQISPLTEAVRALDRRLDDLAAQAEETAPASGAVDEPAGPAQITDSAEPETEEASETPAADAPQAEAPPPPLEETPAQDEPPAPAPTTADNAAELAALRDLSAGQDERSTAVYSETEDDPLFHDLPPFDETGAYEPEPAPEPEGEAPPVTGAPASDAAAADEAAAGQAPPESDAGTEADDGAGYDLTASRGDGTTALPEAPETGTSAGIPDDATPDRPRRVVPVESLLETETRGPRRDRDDLDDGGLGGVGAFGPAADDEPAARRGPERPDDGFRPGEPIDMMREARGQAWPERRRSGRGYLVAAVIFLILLLGGYWFVGTPMFDDLSRRALTLWEEGTDVVGQFEMPGAARDESAPAATAETGTTSPGSTAAADSAEQMPEPTAKDDAGRNDTAADTSQPPPATPAPPAAGAADDTPDEAAPEQLAKVEPEKPAAAPAPSVSEGSDDVDKVLKAARDGDSDAQYQMGVRYRDGIGVDVSYGEAADWFDRAAQQGNVEAQANLGVMYRQGVGVPKDMDLAKLWLHAAARAGHADAQKYLGEVYAQDDAGTPDYFQAARWFREAAEQGLVDAQYNMGVLYEGGLGVPRDFEQAYYWFSLAAQAGDEAAESDVQRVTPLLTQEQREKVDKKIAAFKPVSGEAAKVEPEPGASGDTTETLTRRDQIRELQQLLVARGYDPGEPDGLIGARTREAIREWQKDSNMTETGQVTMGVLEQLRAGG